jgi:peroxiredoxin
MSTRRCRCFPRTVAAFLLSVGGVARLFAQLPVGSTVPQFSLPYLNREGQFTFSRQAGSTTVLYFWTLLSDRNQELVRLNDLYEQQAGRGLKVVGVLAFPEERADALVFERKNGIAFDYVVANDSVLSGYKIGGQFPTVVVLDENARVVRFEQNSFNLDEILAEVEARLYRTPSPKPVPRPRPAPIERGYRINGWGVGKYAALLGAAGSGFGIWHFKKQADSYYSQYLSASDTSEIRRFKKLVKDNDTYSGLCIGSSAVLSVLFVVGLASERTYHEMSRLGLGLGSVELGRGVVGVSCGTGSTRLAIGSSARDGRWEACVVRRF